jgi:hypothetical protein
MQDFHQIVRKKSQTEKLSTKNYLLKASSFATKNS